MEVSLLVKPVQPDHRVQTLLVAYDLIPLNEYIIEVFLTQEDLLCGTGHVGVEGAE